MGGPVASWNVIANRQDLLAARISAYHFDPHLHDTYTVVMMRKGEAYFNIRGERHTAQPGDVFIIQPYEVHRGGNRDDMIHYDVLYPSSRLMADAAGVRYRQGRFPRFADAVFRSSSATDRLAENIESYFSADPTNRSTSGMETALQNVFRNRKSAPMLDPFPEKLGSAIHRACEMMQDHFNNPVELSKLAGEVGFSRYHFIRAFSNATGIAPNVFLRQVRLSEAKNLIRGGLELADVAARCSTFCYDGPASDDSAAQTVVSSSGETPASLADSAG